ncbi:hypothetical protein [Burkholderia pseudomultivorans]|uniref:hypothetical protein n=1 Tax=Burkholderia pseudomultivorans TaxID=1207504 RepID=UPI000B0CF70C|nr:hypothetical protein [Burkholderia pseudomultivorans]
MRWILILAVGLFIQISAFGYNMDASNQSPTSAIDVRKYNAQANDGIDAGAAINQCLRENPVCLIPPEKNGFFVKTPIVIPPGKWLIGVANSAENAASEFKNIDSSWLQCSASLKDACVTWGTPNNLASGGVRNISILRQAGMPLTGQKGLVFAGGYNIRIENVSVSNFDVCYEFDQGISGQGFNNYAQSCRTHYWVFNTWPEFSQTGGRSGANGSGNYGTARDNIYFTSSLGAGGRGTGPNSIDFVNYKFDNDRTECAFRWGGYSVQPGSTEAYNFVNVYKEPLPNGASVFCSDQTVKRISGVRMQNSFISQDVGTADIFKGLSSSTELRSWMLTNNLFYLSGATLAPTETGTFGLYNLVMIGNYMPSTTLTPGGGAVRNDKLTLVGNFYNGTLTINQGAFGWQQLSIIGDQAERFVNNSDHHNQFISMPNVGSSNGVTSVSSLKKCDMNLLGMVETVSDGNSPIYLRPIIGGGDIVTPVLCNGSTWVAH